VLCWFFLIFAIYQHYLKIREITRLAQEKAISAQHSNALHDLLLNWQEPLLIGQKDLGQVFLQNKKMTELLPPSQADCS